jgi:hypothetical protein
MPAALGPRFALEASFLILLAIVVGLADRGATLIVVVMTAGWLLVSLIEYFAWRQTLGVAPVRRYDAVEAPPPPVMDEVVEDVPPPPPAPEPAPAAPPAAVEEETIVQAPPAGEVETVEQADERVAGARRSFVEEEQRTRHRLEPLQPRPRRRWVIFGGHVRRDKPAEGDREEDR